MSKAQPKTDPPADLTREQRLAVLTWVQLKANPPKGKPDPFFIKLAKHRKLIRHYVDECLEWHRKPPMIIQRSNWVWACQKWINKVKQFELEKDAAAEDEKPQMQAKRGVVFTPLTDELDTREMFEGE